MRGCGAESSKLLVFNAVMANHSRMLSDPVQHGAPASVICQIAANIFWVAALRTRLQPHFRLFLIKL